MLGAAVYLDGGGASIAYLLLPALLIFFAIAYPQRAQVILSLFAVGVYLVACLAAGWNMAAADAYVRIMYFATTVVVATFLSRWLIADMKERATSSSAADVRAGMLETVARAARRISSLDASHVVSGALNGALELGFEEAEIWLLDEHSHAIELQRRVGMEGRELSSETAMELFKAARREQDTQIVVEGRQETVAALLHRDGDPAGVFVVKADSDNTSDPLVIECVDLLAAQVSAGLDVARNLAERRGMEERLAHWAFHDSLTDLPNRVLFADRLELALARAARDDSNVAVLFLDLDNFKQINDTLGHATGDELLRVLAHRLHASLRPNDTLARYGGDEFVVLVEQIDDVESAILVAQRILDALSDPAVVGDHELLVHTSIGIAMTSARPGADTDVVRRADIAMYEAKGAGGSRFVVSSSPETDAPHEQAG